MPKHYDLAVVGTGTAATVTALELRNAGWKVAVIDQRRFGGTCALRGCDPKKVLVQAAAALDHARRMAGKGLIGDVRIDWPQLMAFKRTFTDPVPERKEHFYPDMGIDAYHGKARFTGANSLDIEGQALEARFIVLASGAEPVTLGIAGEHYMVTNETFLSLDVGPPRMVLVGGGYIAAEFSSVATRAGAKVTVLQHGQQMLARFDPDLVGWLQASFASAGIDVRTGTSVNAIEKAGDGYLVHANAGGAPIAIEADLVVHAAGRRPALSGLDLQAAGVAIEHGRLKLNEFLQSVSNPAVYAAGDAAQTGPPLTPVSTHDAKVVAANLLHGNHKSADYRAVPSVAFTIPPIASVGLSEAAARKHGHKFRLTCQNTSNWYSSTVVAQPVSGFKVLVDEASGCVLGAHLLGPDADDLINLFALAIRHRLTATDLKETMFAYPTGASDIASML